MIEQSVGAQRRDAADAAFLAAIVPLQALYRDLAVAHELHRDVDQQRGNTLMEVTLELARLRGATAAHAEKTQQLAAALRYAQNLHNLLPRREPGEASAASGGPCLDDADDDPDMAPSARLYLFWEYTSASVCGASCGSCGHTLLYMLPTFSRSRRISHLCSFMQKVVQDRVLQLGNLRRLISCCDAGNHFRSYETAYLTMFKIPKEHSQACETQFLVEKHGLGAM